MVEKQTTLRRRLLRVLPTLGVRVTDVTSGVAVLSRTATTRSRKLIPGAFLVETRRRKDVELTTAGDGAAL